MIRQLGNTPGTGDDGLNNLTPGYRAAKNSHRDSDPRLHCPAVHDQNESRHRESMRPQADGGLDACMYGMEDSTAFSMYI